MPLGETINICLDNLFPTPTNVVAGLPLTHFRSFLELALLNSYFIFNNELYKQVEGLGMGLSLGPTRPRISWRRTSHRVAALSSSRRIGRFIEANFSKLTHNNQIFRNEFVCSQNHFSKISARIIECKILTSLMLLYM